MSTKYVLWRVSNGWLVTPGNTLWEDWDRRKCYGVFHTLQEFVAWVPPQPGEPLHYSPPIPEPPLRKPRNGKISRRGRPKKGVAHV